MDDEGTPPLGSPVSDSDATRSGGEEDANGDTARSGGGEDDNGDTTWSEGEEDDNGVLYGETQALDDDETQAVDDELEEEEEEEVAGDWAETQVVEDSEDDIDAAEQMVTQAVEECGEDGDIVGEKVKTQVVAKCEEEEDGDGMRGDAGDWARTQLVEECEVEDGGNGDWVDTQLVDECQEEERVSDSGDEDVVDWGRTQLVEDSDEEIGDDGDDELSEGTQEASDDDGLLNDETDVKAHGDTKNSGDSDASTNDEGDTAQDTRQHSTSGTNLLTKIVDNSTSCSASLGDHPGLGIDDESYGYVQSHDKDGSKRKGRCSTAKKLFADATPKNNESKTSCFAGLSYLGSQEPGDLSQANALEVVEGLISINGGVSSQEPTPKKLEKAKPPVSLKMGTLKLAEKVDRCRSSNGKPEIFAWVDSLEDDGGGDFFCKNKDILLHKPAARGKSKYPRARKCSTKIAPAENKITNSKLCGRIETLPSSDSRLLKSDVKKSKRASGNRSKKNLLKDLDDQSNAKPMEGHQQKVSVALNDVGQDTQMAVEAIEALAQSSPAKLSVEGEPPVNRDTGVGSKMAKIHSKNGPQKRSSSIQEGVMTRSKRMKVTTDLNPRPQKGRSRGTKMQENAEDHGTKTKHKPEKSVPQKNKVPNIVDGSKYGGTPIAHRTRHTRNNISEYSELCSNKHLKRSMNLTADNSRVGEVRNSHIAYEPEQPTVSERTTEYGLNSVEKESTEHTCANNAQNLQKCRAPSSHPKQRRTPTAMVQAIAPAVTQTTTDHEIQPEVARPSKKRRVFVTSSELLKYARREPSNGRSTSVLSSIIAKSSASSPILSSSVRVTSKTSGFSSSDQPQKEPSDVEDASRSPKNNFPVQSSALKTPSKVLNKLSPTFSPLNPSKASSRSLSKPSVARELLELDPKNALPNRQRKDSRRKDMSSCSILFSHHLNEDVIKRQKKILARLGVCEAFAISDATHFVADSFFRTMNMLEAITLGKLVVTSMWLESCGQAGSFVDDKKYILRDAKKEREIGFSMPISLASACKHPLLLGKRVFVTPNVKPSRQVITSLVSASSGQPLERIGRSIRKEKEAPDDLLVISCEEDYESCVPLLEKGGKVFDSELLLNGIVIQKLEYERHRLFSDCVKQTRSTRWLKHAVQGRFVPVSKS